MPFDLLLRRPFVAVARRRFKRGIDNALDFGHGITCKFILWLVKRALLPCGFVGLPLQFNHAAPLQRSAKNRRIPSISHFEPPFFCSSAVRSMFKRV